MPDNKIEQEPGKKLEKSDLEKLLNRNTMTGIGLSVGAVVGPVYALITQDYGGADKIGAVINALSHGSWNGALYGAGIGFLSGMVLSSTLPDTARKLRDKIKKYNIFE